MSNELDSLSVIVLANDSMSCWYGDIDDDDDDHSHRHVWLSQSQTKCPIAKTLQVGRSDEIKSDFVDLITFVSSFEIDLSDFCDRVDLWWTETELLMNMSISPTVNCDDLLTVGCLHTKLDNLCTKQGVTFRRVKVTPNPITSAKDEPRTIWIDCWGIIMLKTITISVATVYNIALMIGEDFLDRQWSLGNLCRTQKRPNLMIKWDTRVNIDMYQVTVAILTTISIIVLTMRTMARPNEELNCWDEFNTSNQKLMTKKKNLNQKDDKMLENDILRRERRMEGRDEETMR